MGEENSREHSFEVLLGALVDDYDTVDFLCDLVHETAQHLDASEVGIILADRGGHLQWIASSTERMRVLELFELLAAEGPCLDCYRNRQAVVHENLLTADDRWPRFAPMARSLGFKVVYALALQVCSEPIGAMNLFLDSERHLTEQELGTARGFADLATVAILQQRSLDTVSQLQIALDSRVLIEQAKGMLAQELGIDADEAFILLRRHARDGNLLLNDVARDVIKGRITITLTGPVTASRTQA